VADDRLEGHAYLCHVMHHNVREDGFRIGVRFTRFLEVCPDLGSDLMLSLTEKF
jgi:hypothetical protein